MAGLIEDYALLGDTHSAALVGRDGSIDWLCFPRFDSAAFFAALLGDEENGHWRIAPAGAGAADRRCYVDETLVLQSEWDTPDGTVRIIDFMPPRDDSPNVVRIVEGVSGTVRMESTLRLRFDYGSIVPWVRRVDDRLHAIAGPDSVWLHGDVRHHGTDDMASYASFDVRPGERVSFVLTWHPSHEAEPDPDDAAALLAQTGRYWEYWVQNCTYQGPYREAVVRSLITLKALTYEPTGAIVAAATTSLPEDIGGVRNWDYRFCWLRDASLTLQALGTSGYRQEAVDWRAWLLRAIAGDPADLQIMYGVAGERRLIEYELPWLSGYEDSTPVRVGNAAAGQLQLDVYGEVMLALALARAKGVAPSHDAWRLQVNLMEWLEGNWDRPDEGLWEIRGERQHFTHSKVMAWAAFDAAVRTVEDTDNEGPVERWREVRDRIHAQVCARAYDADLGTFTQSYGSTQLDAAVLMILQTGFLPPDDPRVIGTVEAVQKHLQTEDGLVLRYRATSGVDGLAGDEGAFLVCTFWLVDALHMIGRRDEARQLFERLLDLRTDVGLLAEEYDSKLRRLVGNMPQAFSHVGLVNSAWMLQSTRDKGIDL